MGVTTPITFILLVALKAHLVGTCPHRIIQINLGVDRVLLKSQFHSTKPINLWGNSLLLSLLNRCPPLKQHA